MTAPSAAMRAAEEIDEFLFSNRYNPLVGRATEQIAAIIAKHAPPADAAVREAHLLEASDLDELDQLVAETPAGKPCRISGSCLAGLVKQARAALAASPAALCEGCPPVGYPTDKTRCAECPRRAQNATTPAEAWRPIEPADRDGRIEWLGLEADGAVCRVRWYFDESTDDGWYDDYADRDCRPVLIAPFPAPPAEAGR